MSQTSAEVANIGIAMEDITTTHDIGYALTMPRTKTGKCAYRVIEFSGNALAMGEWPRTNLQAVIASPAAFQRFLNFFDNSAACFPVIVYLQAEYGPAHHDAMTKADSFVLPGEALRNLPGIVVLSQCGLTSIPVGYQRHVDWIHRSFDRMVTLSVREHQILNHLARGTTNLDIAHRLKVSPSTIKTDLRRIIGRLKLDNRTQAAIFSASLWLDTETDDTSKEVYL